MIGNSWKVNEAILWAENDLGLSVRLDFDFYNSLAHKKMSGKYNRTEALKLLREYYIPEIMHVNYNETGEKNLYGMTKEEKNVIADYLLTRLEEEGGYVLDNVPLNEIKGRIKLREPTDLDKYYNRERTKCFKPPVGHRGYKTSKPKKSTKKQLVNVRNMF